MIPPLTMAFLTLYLVGLTAISVGCRFSGRPDGSRINETICGHVVGPNDPVAGAHVSASSVLSRGIRLYSAQTYTDDAGRFTLRVSPGTYLMCAAPHPDDIAVWYSPARFPEVEDGFGRLLRGRWAPGR